VNVGSLLAANCSVVDCEADIGGGVINWGSVFLSGCCISGNLAYINGGGIDNVSNMTLYNCTISQNLVVGFDTGSAIGTTFDGTLSGSNYLSHCTVVSNRPSGICIPSYLSAGNSILEDCIGMISLGGHNLIENTNGCSIVGSATGNIYGVNPRLGPLQDNGGPTWTHALRAGSNAIDQGGACVDYSSVPLPTDQRGAARVVDGDHNGSVLCDIGAFEYRPPLYLPMIRR